VVETGDIHRSFTGPKAPILTAVKPLQAVAMGLVIVLLTASVSGYDLLADPLGWLLVLGGLNTLPVPRRGVLQGLAMLSLVVSAVVWFPGARDALNVRDLALAWAAGLPELITLVVLTHALAQTAVLTADRSATAWLRTARTLLLGVTVLPAIVLGGGIDSLDTALGLIGSAVLLLVIVLFFRYADRPWAQPADENAMA
jgi:hypothetical protein